MATVAMEDAGHRSARLRRYQRIFITLCVSSIAFNFLDRATITISASTIRSELGLSATQIGSLLSVWSFAYALSSLPSGFLVDRLGVRRMASGSIFIWSIFQALGGFTTGFAQLLATRLCLGISEAPTGPSNARVVASWFPKSARGTATGIYVSGTQLGPAFAPPILTALLVTLGWRGMFIAMGIVGVIFAATYYVLYRDIEKTDLTREEETYLTAGADEEPQSVITLDSWLRLFRFKTIIGLMIGSFVQGWAGYIFIGWMPLMLETQYKTSLAQTGVFAALPFIGGVAGALIGGFVSDRLDKIGIGAVRSRKLPIVFGILGLALFTALTGYSHSVVASITFSFFALLCSSAATSGMWTAAAVLVPRRLVGSVGTLFNFAFSLGGAISPLVTGYTLDLTGSFIVTLFIGAGIGGVGACIVAALVHRPVHETDLQSYK
ncbi:MFS transporter [Paraburkholderia sp. Ac-20336]|uniref:MFS transporter n=1 Tax=Paraburkholderia sp. Ac-20336 TaxID=2703886 RepID=UPI0019807E71|nr:MFS transporter [Paraburkholderia sp. Ac-20336]MBN3801943.1 MFS transporter [Paraburkholderia sp. Ac-20336]